MVLFETETRAANESTRSCNPPLCKIYASVKSAQCERIELAIHYPSHQYGYNKSIDYWGTIKCDESILGFKVWILGFTIIKNFSPSKLNTNLLLNDFISFYTTASSIVIDNLRPGERYCFDIWTYNSCGKGPISTLEGVCAKNTEECHSNSDEHCELDEDYFW